MADMHDVVVVGAGFTGLCAAQALVQQGFDVVVLEARDRVGGRTESIILADGTRIDSGGQFLCDDMAEVLALARRYGKTLVRAPVEGRFIQQPPLNPQDEQRIYDEAEDLRWRMKRTEPDDPAIAGLTVADWLGRQDASDGGKRAFRSMIEGLWCRSIGELPLWYLISNDRCITNEESELQYFLAQTMHSLAEDVARELGDRVHLGVPVERIRHSADGVEILAGDRIVRARGVIVAVPPVMASRLRFEPALPEDLTVALSVWRSGTVIKALVRYDRPFWRDSGLSGMVMWADQPGLFACDVSRSDDQAALVVFIGGPLAEEWRERGEDGIRKTLREKLAAALGDEARHPRDITLRDWTDDPWSAGGYSDSVTDLLATGADETMRRGTPEIVFACSELSPSFPGYVEGAIVAGRAAAVKTADALARK